MKKNDHIQGRPIRLNRHVLTPNSQCDYAEVMFLGDIHYGSKQCDVPRLLRMIDYCVKNDVYVSAVGVDGAGTSHLLNSKPIENVPLREPFRIAIVVASGFIEIYMNGELVQTMNLGYPLKNIDGTTKSYYFATPLPVFNSVQVANISYWNNILSSKTIRAQHQLRPLDKTLFIK